MPGRRDSRQHQGVGLDDAAAGAEDPGADRQRLDVWRIERLIPYARNARTHTDAQVAAIAASIKEWGWTTPPPVPRIQAPTASEAIAASIKLKDLLAERTGGLTDPDDAPAA
jgi:hypothetical protein